VTSKLVDYDVQIALLELYSHQSRSTHIGNIVGTEYQRGPLELKLKTEFGVVERAQAWRCAQDLVDASLLLPTYSDMADPDKWLIITDAGRDALRRGALDEVDAALQRLSPSFVEMRRGAWRAASATAPDALRQAAHSGRELISQVLQCVAPDDEVLEQPDYRPRADGKVTRRDRYRLAVRKRSRGWSENDVDLIEQGAAFMESQQRKLDASAHAHAPVDPQAVRDALVTVDIILRLLIV
jgi:hypothetical protein